MKILVLYFWFRFHEHLVFEGFTTQTTWLRIDDDTSPVLERLTENKEDVKTIQHHTLNTRQEKSTYWNFRASKLSHTHTTTADTAVNALTPTGQDQNSATTLRKEPLAEIVDCRQQGAT